MMASCTRPTEKCFEFQKIRPNTGTGRDVPMSMFNIKKKPMYRQFHRCIGIGNFNVVKMHPPLSSSYIAPEISSTVHDLAH